MENSTFDEAAAIELRKAIKESYAQFELDEERRRLTQKDLDFVCNIW